MLRPLVLPALLAALCALAAAQVDPPPSLPAAAAQAAQLRRGESVYVLVCAMCHGDRQEGVSGPALSGGDFRATFGGLPPLALHGLIVTTMPDDRPGSLSPQEALDVTAYLLWAGGLPLPAGALDAQSLHDAPLHQAPPPGAGPSEAQPGRRT